MALRPIHHTFGPHVDGLFALRALGLLVRPWRWRNGPSGDALRLALHQGYKADPFLFASGREGLLALMRSLEIGPGDEVIVQAYTCIVVPNAITAAGAAVLYADIERETLSMDPEAVEALITPRTKAVVCQHTFGIPAPLSELRALCDRHGIPLIEDCAHILPDANGPLGVARTGDYVLLSFGRDKAISGVAGGAILARTARGTDRLKEEEHAAIPVPRSQVLRFLLYPLVYAIGRPLYGIVLGKALLYAAGKAHLLLPLATEEEKQGRQSPVVHRIPNACAAMALRAWKRIGVINGHRRRIATFYLTEGRKRGWPIVEGACAGLPLQKLPLFVAGAEGIRKSLKARNIHLHDGWTGCVVCPGSADAGAAGYRPGSDPVAEESCVEILSLPTHPTMSLSQARTLVRELDPLLPSR